MWCIISQVLSDDLGGFNSIEDWHVVVHQYDGVGSFPCQEKLVNLLNSFFTIRGCVSLKLVLIELCFQDVSVDMIVVNDKDKRFKNFVDLRLRIFLFLNSAFILASVLNIICIGLVFGEKGFLHFQVICIREVSVYEKLPLHVCSAPQNSIVLIGRRRLVFLSSTTDGFLF